jgi:hypothetical protein
VPIDTLDHQVTERKMSKVDFIKIDVEGFEQAVLEGAVATLERDHPVLFIELAARIPERSYVNPHFRETLAWLEGKGYRVWRCRRNGLLCSASSHPPDGVSMYLALHKTSPRACDFQIFWWVHGRWLRRSMRKVKERSLRVAQKGIRALRRWKRGAGS